jgi:hypothetical protein
MMRCELSERRAKQAMLKLMFAMLLARFPEIITGADVERTSN